MTRRKAIGVGAAASLSMTMLPGVRAAVPAHDPSADPIISNAHFTFELSKKNSTTGLDYTPPGNLRLTVPKSLPNRRLFVGIKLLFDPTNLATIPAATAPRYDATIRFLLNGNTVFSMPCERYRDWSDSGPGPAFANRDFVSVRPGSECQNYAVATNNAVYPCHQAPLEDSLLVEAEGVEFVIPPWELCCVCDTITLAIQSFDSYDPDTDFSFACIAALACHSEGGLQP